MRRIALAALALAGCGGLCPPGDDGSCEWGDPFSGGGSSDRTPYVSFGVAAIAPGQVFVTQAGDEGTALWRAPLDQLGLPTRELAEIAHEPDGDMLVWPGPGGQALVTYGAELELLEADGRFHARRALSAGIPYQVEVVFDGEAYLVAWSEWAYEEERYRLQIARVFPDGSVGSITEPARFGTDDQNSAFDLATDGLGGAVLVWGVRIGWRLSPSSPLELRAVELADGLAIADPWVFAADEDARALGELRALFATADGYHVLTTRGDVIDLHLDLATDTATEVISPLAIDPLPDAWVAGPDGYLAYDASQAWMVDAALGSSILARVFDRDERVTAVAATATGYVVGMRVYGDPTHHDLARIDVASAEQVTVATDYELPAEGCAAGGRATTLAPALALLFLCRRRRVEV